MFSRPSFTRPSLMKFAAAFFTDRLMAPLLLVVPTIRFASVMRPCAVGFVMVEESPPRGLDDAHALVRCPVRNLAELRSGDLGVARQLDPSLGRVKKLDDPRPMRGQGLMDRLAAQCFVHPVVFLVRQGSGHPIGNVEAGQRSGLVDPASGALHQTLPADLLQNRELQIRPGLHVLFNMVQVFRRPETWPALFRRAL